VALLNVDVYAKIINDYCDNGDYFWAYGFVKETKNMWKTQVNLDKLCADAQTMVGQTME